MRQEEERSVVAVLSAKYPIFAMSTIQRWVANESGKYTSAKIQKYIPVLVQRSVDATLSELARTEGTSSNALTLDTTDRMDLSLRMH
jgi:hypothetical protein